MADNENPINTHNNGQADTSNINQEETNQEDYQLQLEDEVIRLRKIEELYLKDQQARLTQQRDFGYQFPSPQHQKKLCSFKTFKSCNPSEFEGSTNPTVTLNWLRDVERKFEVCQCEEELKVTYAAQLLKGQAMVWWDSITAHLTPQQRSSISWTDFHNEVCKQFCSEFDMIRIRQEFLDLKLTDQMSIDDLINQFTEKLRFVQQWVPDDRMRINHFVGTLPPHYRTSVRLAGTLTQAFTLARSVDSDIRAEDKLNKDKVSQQSRNNSSGNKGNQQTRRVSFNNESADRILWCVNCKSRHTGPCTSETARCGKCGLFGHDIRDCAYPRFVCWNCQKEGHRAGQCPEKVRQGSGLAGSSGSGSSSSVGQKRKNVPPATARAFRMTVDETVGVDNVETGIFCVNFV